MKSALPTKRTSRSARARSRKVRQETQSTAETANLQAMQDADRRNMTVMDFEPPNWESPALLPYPPAGQLPHIAARQGTLPTLAEMLFRLWRCRLRRCVGAAAGRCRCHWRLAL